MHTYTICSGNSLAKQPAATTTYSSNNKPWGRGDLISRVAMLYCLKSPVFTPKKPKTNARKQERVANNEKKRSADAVPEKAQKLDLADKDFK